MLDLRRERQVAHAVVAYIRKGRGDNVPVCKIVGKSKGKGYVILQSVVFNIDVFANIYVTEHINEFTLKVSICSLFTDVRLRTSLSLSLKNDIL